MNPNSFQPNKSTQAEESLPIAMNARRRSIVVRAPTVKVYERWLQFENFRDLSRRCEKCERSMRPASPLAGFAMAKNDNVSFRVLLRIPEQRIAWWTISHGLAFGVVSFERTFNPDTEITLRIRSIYDQKVITIGKEDARSHRLRQLETQSSQKDT